MLSCLQEMIKKYIGKDLSEENLKEMTMGIFDFYTKNTKGHLSSEDVSSLKELSTVTTNHMDADANDETKLIYKILLLRDGRFVTCSEDTTIRIRDFYQNIPEIILIGHTKAVRDLIILKSGKLCSASEDRTIKIWDIKKATCESTLLSHFGVVKLIELPNNILISGGEDHILFWNLEATNNEVCIKILPNEGLCKSIILLSNEEMVCVSDNNINIFRIYGCDAPLKKLTGHRDFVHDLLLHTDRQTLLSSSADNTMRIWNIQNGSCIRILRGNGNFCCYGMVWFNNNIVGGVYENGEIKLWNVYSGECVRTLQGQPDVGFRLIVDSKGVLISYGCGNKLTLFGNSQLSMD